MVAYLDPVCSPGGREIAAVQFPSGGRADGRARLALLSAEGAFRRYLTPSGRFIDGEPEWAVSGIFLARTPTGGGASELWFARPGGATGDTGLRATEWDWSITPPSGLG
jgi:hypothetical protein